MEIPPAALIESLEKDPAVTHVAVVHCETTTGMLNPVRDIGEIVQQYQKTFIVDAMSSFGGIPMDMADVKADYLIMTELGFAPLLARRYHSPFITSFLSPDHADYEFGEFYRRLKEQGFVIYPGKATEMETFRIGSIGDVHEPDMERLINAIETAIYWV